MILKKTNIEERLARAKFDALKSNEILEEVQKILNSTTNKEKRISSSISNGNRHISNAFDFDQLQTDKIFHISQIKEICIDYRLRFLNSKYFKGDIPQEAIDKIKALEKNHQIEINGFKIVAPSKLFKLNDIDDPLLFAPIGNEYYYLIHKWGNDLHPLRKILVWPFKNIVNLSILVFAISLLATLLIPNGLFSKTNTNSQFFVMLFFTFKSIAAVVIFYGFAMGKNFNPAIWNSRFFNA
jgi:hypothetical protein